MQRRIIGIISIILAVFILCSCGHEKLTANYDSVSTSLSDSEVEDQAETVSGKDITAEENAVEDSKVIEEAVIDEQEPQRNPVDYTVDLTDYDVFQKDDLAGRELLMVMESQGSVKYPRPEQISKFSPYILIGTIEDVCFTDMIGGWDSAHILCNFRVDEALRGDFVTGDQITIEMYGGYIRGEIYDQSLKGNGMVSSSEYVEIALPEHEPFPETGTRCVLFLRESTNVEGAYSRVGDYTGEYLIATDSSCSRYLSEGETWVYGTEADIKAAVYQNPFESEESAESTPASFYRE